MRGIAALLLLATSPAGGQDLFVGGRVVDAVTGRPLARATVSLLPLTTIGLPIPGSKGALFTSDADGVFRFQALAAGQYQLSASRRGYATAAYEEHDNFFASVVVGPGMVGSTRLLLRLKPFASITGTLQDSSGDPVDNGTVMLFAQARDGSGEVRQRQSQVLKDGSSRFSFEHLPPGSYYLAASGRPWFAQPANSDGTPSPLDVVYGLTFFDGVANSDAAQAVELAAGEIMQAKLNLHPVPALHVLFPQHGPTNTVQIPNLSQPAFDESIQLPAMATGLPAIDGKPPAFSISVAPGTYELGWGGSTSVVNVINDATIDNEPGVFAPTSISGQVAMADGTALPKELQLQLTPVARETSRHTGSRQRGPAHQNLVLQLGENGSFHADTVSPGEYRLRVLSPSLGRAYLLNSMAAAGGEVRKGSVLSVSSNTVTLAANLIAANAAINGHTAGGQSGVMILAIPQTGSVELLSREDESNSDGSWHLQGMAAGRYRILAIRNGWDLAWQRPDVLAPYLARGGVTVDLAAGNTSALPEPLPVLNR